jgi:hypothetical protein
MSGITLWGRLSSCNVQKVVWALEELELPYEHIPVGGQHGGNRTADYLALNPNGLVPTLRDRGLVVWESHAIVRYLGAEFGSGLIYPTEPRARAPVDEWTDWTATTFQPAWIGAVLEPGEDAGGRAGRGGYREVAGSRGALLRADRGPIGASALSRWGGVQLRRHRGGRVALSVDHNGRRTTGIAKCCGVACSTQRARGLSQGGECPLCGPGWAAGVLRNS